MSSSSNSVNVEEVQTLLYPNEEVSSGEDPPMSEWSSLIIEIPEENRKRALWADGLYSPGSGEVCGKYISMSDSDVPKHVYYNYPAILDPGIEKAILVDEKPVVYPDDGQELYLALCKEMGTCVVRIFHTSLVTDEINLSYYGVEPKSVRNMALALKYNRYVRCFNLTDNFLNDDACYHLGQMLITNTTLRELNLTGCRIGPSGMLRLGSTLAMNRRLEEIILPRNCLGDQGGVYFAKQISEGAIVPRVNLSKNELGRGAALALAEAFEFQNKITHLDLSWNSFFHTPTTAKMLDQLSVSVCLVDLNLAWNSLEGEKVAIAIGNIFRSVPSLKVMNLSNNRFRGEDVTQFTANLMYAKKLSTLDLSYNPMTVVDVYSVLEKMLRPRVKVNTLLLDGIAVNKAFLTTLAIVKNMKSRKNVSITHGKVLQDWTIPAPDARKLILERANFLGGRAKKRSVDIGLYFLALNKEFERPISLKVLVDRLVADKVPLDEAFLAELAAVFPGAKSAKSKMVNIRNICEYINRLWPDKQLPPTPPPEPEPEPEPAPLPAPAKEKGKGKKVDFGST